MRHTAALFLTLLLFASSGRAVAQATIEPSDGYFEHQVTRLLKSADEASQARALHLIIYYESRDGARYDFSEAAPRLVEIVERSDDLKQRILAETALHMTDEKVWHELSRRVALRTPPRYIR